MADQRIQATEDMVGAGHATKTDTLNRLAVVEHENDGTHKQATMEAQATPATPATDHGMVYFKLVGGVPELHVLDDEGNETQITTGGTVNAGTEATTKDNIALNAFRIAVNGSLTQFAMVDGILDEFEDEASVDTATSTNETYDATLDLYKPTPPSEVAIGQGVGTAIGDMTENGGLAAAFDSNFSQAFTAAAVKTGTTGNAGKDWGSGVTKKIAKFAVHSPTTEGFTESSSPTDLKFKLEGSQDNSAWTTLFTSAGFTDGTNLTKTYSDSVDTFIMTTAYRYHRVVIINGAGAKVGYEELEFWEAGTIPNMTLLSNAFTATAVPTTGRIVLFQEDVDTTTINADIKAYVSRDGGTTYTQITLADQGDYESGKQILSGKVDISAQPSGTSMKWKVETLNNKNLNLHGVSLSWS